MHHAYPRECPYPHISGTTNPLAPNEWMDLAAAMTPEAKAEVMQWTSVEELVVSRQPAAPGIGQSLRSGLRIAVLFALAASLVKAVRPSALFASRPEEKLQVHLV